MYIANTDFDYNWIVGKDVNVMSSLEKPGISNKCIADIQDGGFYECNLSGSKILFTGNGVIAMAEFRVYDGFNALQHASVLKTSKTADSEGMGIENLFTMYPRTQSSERAPNGEPDMQSCARFTKFPVEATIDLGGYLFVNQILAVGNAAYPLNSNNFNIYASFDSKPDFFRDECENSHLFPPNDKDYMTENTRLGDQVDCDGRRARYITIYKYELDEGAEYFDLCTLGVMAYCDCYNMDLIFDNDDDKEPRDIEVEQGKSITFTLGKPSYSFFNDPSRPHSCDSSYQNGCEFNF